MSPANAAAAAHVTTFPARNLANALWGLAKLQHNPGQALLQALTNEVLKKLDQFIPQHIANTLWAYANLGGPLLACFGAWHH